MRISILLCVLLSTAMQSFGQRTIEYGKQWNVLTADLWGPNSSTTIYEFRKDSIVNGVTYLQLFAKTDTLPTAEWYPGKLVREDSINRIYTLLPNGEESLIYDFSLNTGDSITVSLGQQLLVYDVDSIQLLDGSVRKRMAMILADEPNPMEPYSGYQYWIQGIGSLTRLIAYEEAFYTDFPYVLLCHFENQEVIWADNENSPCFISPNTEIRNDKSVNIYPNPAKSELYIESDCQIDHIQLYKVEGTKLGTFNLQSQKVDLSHIQNGLYFIEIVCDKQSTFRKVVVQR